ncbi:putative Receptor like protein 53 [Hibiscus syriacus]|uniref:Receptor like protein 53 n=1 Tax=Hibiscus syriacus TaxID=106335 RepID=A0A6A2YLQ4_HIBSY|nr:heavy metal-associated isoprenylated plant protein 47-like [Hibiscus syriacus]KAE8680259.1 putative Receptor like protein 53 [Hibiscus syriacus]
MLQQKIVVKVSMQGEKRRTGALKIAAAADGVVSVALYGPRKDKLMIVGDGVDAVCLTSSLRKQLSPASLETVEEVKDPKPMSNPIICCLPPQPQPEFFTVVTDPHPSPCAVFFNNHIMIFHAISSIASSVHFKYPACYTV